MSASPGSLAPLAARYARWLGLAAAAVHDTTDEDPASVQAMQLILRVEQAAPPQRTALLEAAAAAAVAVCLDPRAAPGGPWHDAVAGWVGGRIRKVSRRARGAHWLAVQDLPGLTVHRAPDGALTRDAGCPTDGDAEATATTAGVDGVVAAQGSADFAAAAGAVAQVRALLPGLVAELPREVSRLQVAGTELPLDQPGPPPPAVPVLWLNPAVPMTVGKAAAQVGHATMIAAALLQSTGRHDGLASWAAQGYRVAVRTPSAAAWRTLHPGDDPSAAWRRQRVLAVRDAGFTEVAPGTVTVLAQLP